MRKLDLGKIGLEASRISLGCMRMNALSEKDAEIRKWSLMVAKQIKAKVANREEAVVFLCGKNYRKYIQNLFPKHTAPVSHYGIGKQMQFFKNNTAKGEA